MSSEGFRRHNGLIHFTPAPFDIDAWRSECALARANAEACPRCEGRQSFLAIDGRVYPCRHSGTEVER
jgi:hypothetical protein